MSDDPQILDNLLEKARRSFEAAASLLEDGHADFAASRAYYGCFYIAEALLLSKGLSYSRHSQVVAQFGRQFAKTEELDTRYHRLLIEAFGLRQAADYAATPKTVSEDDAEHTIREGKEFLAAARRRLER
ncbi:HEPN domain-containing protein [soil metagenome]